MRDINIQVYDNHKVNTENDYAGLNLENLQGNITFNFDNFVSGQARVEVVINNQDGYILLDQVGETYTLPIKSSLLTGDSILMQLVIDEVDKTTYHLTADTDINHNKTYYIKVGNSFEVVEQPQKADLGTYYEAEIPVWKSEVFYLAVGNSINATTTIPEEYPGWVEVINGLINEVDSSLQEVETALTEMDNLNIDVSNKVGGKVTITFTNKEGTEKQVTIDDGIGIVSITKSSTSGNVDTYTITYTDGHTTTFQVTNGIDGTDGVGITSIYLTGTSGLTDTYTILYTNGETTTFQVKNGKGITKIEKISTTGLIDTYKITYNDGTTQNYEVGNGRGIVSIVKTSTSGYVDTYTITYNDNTTSTFEITNGEVTQAQLDEVIAENDYLNSIIDQIVPKTTGTGTSITLDDTLQARMNMSLSPSELEQETTTGKNLASLQTSATKVIGDVQFTIENGIIKINGTTTTNNRQFNFDNFQTNTDTAMFWIEVVGYTDKSSANGSIMLQVSDDGSTNWSVVREISLNSTAGKQYSVSLDSTKYYRIQFYTNQNTFTNATIKVQLEYGSSKTSFEPYTGGIASPNPQYPQEIHTISGGNTIKVVGKNLLNPALLLQQTSWNKFTIQLKPNTNYTMSSNYTGSTLIVYMNSADTYGSSYQVYSGHSVSIQTDSSGLIYIQQRTTDVSTLFTDYEWLLEEGSTATSYTPYQEQTAQVNLGDLEYSKMPNTDYSDEFYRATDSDTSLISGKWYLKKNIVKIILDGINKAVSQVNTYATGVYAYTCFNTLQNLAISQSGVRGLTKSNYFKSGSTSDYTINNYIYSISANVVFTMATEMTVEQANEWLENNNVEFWYPLATPTYTPLNDTLQSQLDTIESMLLSYKQQTNISQINNDLPFVITSTALKEL